MNSITNLITDAKDERLGWLMVAFRSPETVVIHKEDREWVALILDSLRALTAERDALENDLRLNAAMLAKQTDLAREAETERDALREKYENPEPGLLIAEISCPSCGRPLRVEHGDDEGEIGVLTND